MDGEEFGLIDGTGTGDEGSGGDDSFVEETSGEDEGGDSATAGGEGAGGGEGDGRGTDDDGASRAIVKFKPEEVRKGIREIVSANPDFAKKFPELEKTVTRALYKDAQIQNHGGLQRVNEVMEALEVHGGLEAIQEMADSIVGYRELEQGFERGDPAVIDGWAKDFPLGFKKLVAPAIDKLESVDKAHYEAVASYVIRKTFESYGVFGAFAKLGEYLGAKNTDEAVKSFNEIARFLSNAKSLAEKARPGRDARDEELDEREKEIAARDKKAFYGSVRQDVNTQVTAAINRQIRSLLPQGRKIKVEQANRLRASINSELARVANSNADYQRNYESTMNARNKDRAVRFIVSNALRKVPAVVKQVMGEFDLLSRGTGAGNGNNGAQRRGGGDNGASRTVAGRPKTSEVDFTRTDKATFLATMGSHGQAWGLDGKLHKW